MTSISYKWANTIVRRIIFALVIFAYSYSINGQELSKINITSLWNNDTIKLGKIYTTKNGDTISFSNIKFYLSNLYNNDPTNDNIETIRRDYHLIDLSDKTKNYICINNDEYNQLGKYELSIGVDSITNSMGIGKGDLDPALGMYWTWQTGYIQVKLEGNYSGCVQDSGEFTLHLGGYDPPYNTHQKLIFSKHIAQPNTLIFHFDQLFDRDTMTDDCTIMSPGSEASKWMLQLSKIIELK